MHSEGRHDTLCCQDNSTATENDVYPLFINKVLDLLNSHVRPFTFGVTYFWDHV